MWPGLSTPWTELLAPCRAWLSRCANSCSGWTAAWRSRRRCAPTSAIKTSWRASPESSAPIFSTSIARISSTSPYLLKNKHLRYIAASFYITKWVWKSIKKRSVDLFCRGQPLLEDLRSFLCHLASAVSCDDVPVPAPWKCLEAQLF